jgi:tRNA pseudouridine13 synthase
MSSTQLHHCPLAPTSPLPRLTADLPGTGGYIRALIEDFEVEELPLYLPCGEGEHLYLRIEKIDTAAENLRRHIARALNVPAGEIGMAGLKDRRAVTRQWISVPRKAEALVPRLETSRIRVLEASAHKNKLRTGHLAGNRFRIVVRGVQPGFLALARAKVERLLQVGMANFYGSQRMGHGGATLAAGWALGQGLDGVVRVRLQDETVHTLDLRDRPHRRLAASALQSELFNRTLVRRMQGGVADAPAQQVPELLLGDLCRKTDTGGQFCVEDVERELLRLQAGAIEITGPMWGPKMPRPQANAAELEAQVLAESGLGEEVFAKMGALAEGTRRPLLVHPQHLAVAQLDDALVVTFELPSGAFATGLIHELVGPAPGVDGHDDLHEIHGAPPAPAAHSAP